MFQYCGGGREGKETQKGEREMIGIGVSASKLAV
jgi:hypothetical protein